MISLAERLKRDNIRMDVKYVTFTEQQQHEYRVTLRRRGRQWTLPFFMGNGLTAEPDLLSVVYSIISDVQGYRECSGFWDWAETHGYEDADEYAEEESYVRLIYAGARNMSERADKFFRGDFWHYTDQTDWRI